MYKNHLNWKVQVRGDGGCRMLMLQDAVVFSFRSRSITGAHRFQLDVVLGSAAIIAWHDRLFNLAVATASFKRKSHTGIL